MAAGTAKDAKPLRRGGAGADSIPAELHDRLQDRRAELEDTVLTRVYAVSDPADISDPTYADGLRAAIDAAIDYALACILGSERNPPPIPAPLLVQARIAARSGVGLDTVLRRYFAGYGLLGDLLAEEAEAMGSIRAPALKGLLRRQASLFDRLIAAVSEEHGREQPNPVQTSERRKLESVQRLLDGELTDASELAYDLKATHMGLVVKGSVPGSALRAIAVSLDRRLLMVSPDEQETWAWLGGRAGVDAARVRRAVEASLSPETYLAIGVGGHGMAGWQLTHRQARAALPVALRGAEQVVSYADVALLASIMQDDLLTISLRKLYLEPLARGRDGGKTAKKTLRAYIACNGNVTATAARLGVNRDTVSNRLRAAEEAIGCPLDAVVAELDAILRLEELKAAR